jgi:hypothetical protein
MRKAISYATIALAVAPGIAAWILRTSLDFEWLVLLGTLALVGAILTLGRQAVRREDEPVACAGIHCAPRRKLHTA